MVPGAEASGLVAPSIAGVSTSEEGGWVLRPVLTTSLPSQTMAMMGPEFMSRVITSSQAWNTFNKAGKKRL
jgi:hypothetical protein